ncbi:MAG TPA: YetF domain-containing protein [Blastocatellia bacterium]|nr:YetF domain-containing protein [Blastocatellia bacterium]
MMILASDGGGILQDMFHLAIPVAEKMLRPIVVYVFLVILLRVFGKRELAQLNPFDLVVLLSLSNTVQNAIIGDDNSVTGGLIGAATLLTMNYFVVRFLFRHRRLDEVLEGSPTTLIKEGKVDQQALAKELLTESELRTVAHRQGFSDLDDIDSCTIEPGGTFFIKSKTPPADERQHFEILGRLDQLSAMIEELRASIKNDAHKNA